MWFKKKLLISDEYKSIEKKLVEISSKLELLELNYRLLAGRIKTKLGKLPSEDKKEMSPEEKDFYRGVLSYE